MELKSESNYYYQKSNEKAVYNQSDFMKSRMKSYNMVNKRIKKLYSKTLLPSLPNKTLVA